MMKHLAVYELKIFVYNPPVCEVWLTTKKYVSGLIFSSQILSYISSKQNTGTRLQFSFCVLDYDTVLSGSFFSTVPHLLINLKDHFFQDQFERRIATKFGTHVRIETRLALT